jgi:hypothetical protein
MQSNKMPKIVKFLIFVVSSMALLADVAFVVWATKFNFLIVTPVVVSAAYLSYLVAYCTIMDKNAL